MCQFGLTITIYFINPSGKLKLSFNRTMKNVSQIMNHMHIYTLMQLYYDLVISNPKLPGIMLSLCQTKM